MFQITKQSLALRRFICAAVLAAPIGCSSQAPVPRGPRTETSDTQMSEPVMAEFLDPMVQDAAVYLSGALPLLPQVKASPSKYVFAVPQTLKIAGNIPDVRIEQVLLNLRAALQGNENFSSSFAVVNATELQADGTLKAMQGDAPEFRDPLQRAPDPTRVTRYDPSIIYTMTGRMYLANDPMSGHKQLNFTIEVNKLVDRTNVIVKQIIYHLKWDGSQRRWVRDI